MPNTEMTLKDRLLPLVQAMGYEFVGFETLRQGRGSLLRIYIDSPNGITVDDCSTVSRQVSAMLDVEDPIKGAYTLEISSPGIDRPLFEKPHYQKFIDSEIKVRVHIPIDNRRNFVGQLLKVGEETITLLVDENEYEIAFSNIDKAKVCA